jgi:hypothetical protein
MHLVVVYFLVQIRHVSEIIIAVKGKKGDKILRTKVTNYNTYDVLIIIYLIEKLNGYAVSNRRAIAEVKQCWSVMRWVSKNLLSRAPP